jgi:hypothetical protein
LSADKIVERAISSLPRGYGDRALEADFGDILDDALEYLFAAKARIDDGDPVNRDHLDALGGPRHRHAARRNGARSASVKKPSSDSKRKASSDNPL